MNFSTKRVNKPKHSIKAVWIYITVQTRIGCNSCVQFSKQKRYINRIEVCSFLNKKDTNKIVVSMVHGYTSTFF